MTHYHKLEEGVTAYKAIGLQYPEIITDTLYDQFLRQTKKSLEDINQKIDLSMKSRVRRSRYELSRDQNKLRT
jgi:hypothetical protein